MLTEEECLLIAASICCLMLIYGERNERKIWTKKWLRRRDDQGRGTLNMLHNELRIEDKPSYTNYLRMNEETFNTLLEKTAHLYTYQDTNMRQCICARDRLSATLRYLATGETITSLSYSLRIGKSTLSKIIAEVIDAIYITLKDQYLQCPTTKEEWLQIAKEFYTEWNFPNCIGSIDGKHISFRPLKEDGSFYRNYKGSDSIVLLAVVDAKYRFLMVDVGINGRVSDGGVYQRISRTISENLVNLPENSPLPNSADIVPYVLVGDDAFPFRYHGLDYEQKIYNYRVSRAQRVVENAFGILTNKFRIFLNPMNLNVEKVEKITLACCVLHNFLLKRRNLEEDEEEIACTLQNVNWKPGRKSSYRAMIIRDKFLEYFYSVGKVPWQDDKINI